MKRELVDREENLSIRRQCKLLGISRASLYYEPKGEKPENVQMMNMMDQHMLEEPTAGVLTMQSMLKDNGYIAGYERIRRLMRKANLYPIYPRKHLTVLGEKKYIFPYLLRELEITRPNQVWQIDITYIPMKQGFMYLTAIIDVFSRYIVAWGLSNSLDAQSSLSVVQEAVRKEGKPEILNSDQGSQFTCEIYVKYLKKQAIQISMDGKGRAIDNIYIERFWRTIKYQYIYLNPAENATILFKGIQNWLCRYHNRDHQGIDRNKPQIIYRNAA